MSKSTTSPRRRVVLKLEVGADSWRDLEGALNAVRHRLAEREQRGEERVLTTSGGVSFGFHLEADEDPDVDHDSYFVAVDQWIEEDRKRDEGYPDRAAPTPPAPEAGP